MSSLRPATAGERKSGFTLVELLVVITIIAILIALLLPAVQAAREAARRLQCQNHLKQLGLACLNHEQALRRFPAGGWGYGYIGDPNLPTDRDQPGGWVFNVLPYLEQQSLHDQALGRTGLAKSAALTRMNATPLEMLNCPSRRLALAYPAKSWTPPVNAGYATNVAKTDYAANAGDGPWSSDQGFPYGDAATSTLAETTETGVIYQRSVVKVADIKDGTSNTYLLGEKYMNVDNYANGVDNGDDQSAYVGYDIDVSRWTKAVDSLNAYTPAQDTPGAERYYLFGSAHSGGLNMLFCDGSVQSINYSINPEVHRCLGNRKDGKTVDRSKF
jgi:prepilin-type N-terminal cleavage/methylation domain-containing protein/prepilin-type processing-associated H-X9-DG protein